MRNAYRPNRAAAGGGLAPAARGLRAPGRPPSSPSPSRSPSCRAAAAPARGRAGAPRRRRRRRSPPRAEMALVLDASTPAHAVVADEIVAALSPRRYRVTRFTTDAARGARRAARPPRTVVAVGAEAVRAARAALPNTPLVFCQVPAFEEALATGWPIWGVQTLPPLVLQLKNWQAVDPTLRTIALIVSASGAALAAEARCGRGSLAGGSARRNLGLRSRDAVSIPPARDERRRPVAAARQRRVEPASARRAAALCVVARHRRADVQRSAARRGALLTATAVPADVAATVAHVVERVVAGRTAELPPMTPLSAAELAVNSTVAATLGLPPVAEQRWVT